MQNLRSLNSAYLRHVLTPRRLETTNPIRQDDHHYNPLDPNYLFRDFYHEKFNVLNNNIGHKKVGRQKYPILDVPADFFFQRSPYTNHFSYFRNTNIERILIRVQILV